MKIVLVNPQSNSFITFILNQARKTGRLFLVASQFLEVTRVFGDVPDEIEDRLKYAKWKAADIVRALNEGRQPQPGPPTSSPPPETTIQSPPIVAAGLNALPSMSGQYPPPSSASAVNSFQPTSPPQLAPIVLPPINNPPVPVAIGSPPAAMNYGSTSPTLDPSTLASAEKLARFAVSALQFEDIPTAIQNMEQALLLLRGLQKK
jgi:vacuolar protein sorting-associated protein VTA1